MSFAVLDKQDPVWTLTLTRPEALNALNQQVLKDLDQALGEVREAFPAKCRVLIVTGAGEKSFVAGADIREMKDLAPEAALQFAEKGQAVLRKFEELPQAVIAAVNGFALGGGLELALACDFIWASENARVGLPEVGLGLIPGFGGTVRLARVVGLNLAREMIFSGEALKAEQAKAVGLINRVVPAAELMTEVKKLATLIANRGPLAVAAAKKSVLTGFDQARTEAFATEAKLFGPLFATRDTREGTTAFTEKRPAQFQGT